MSDRAVQLSAFQFRWPIFDYAFLAATMRWMMLFLIVATTVWLLLKAYRRFLESGQDSSL
jgi:hypothetical protein